MSQESPNIKTHLINVIGGPGGGKSVCCALLFAKLKILGYRVEYVQEVAKGLVWAENYELLTNQYWVSQAQFKALNALQGKVDFIITDGCLLHGIYYNRHNDYNVSNIDKTEKYIINKFNEFNNINIFLNRGNFSYEQEGREQTEEEALKIDEFFIDFLDKHQIPYQCHQVKTIESSQGYNYSIDKIIEYIVE